MLLLNYCLTYFRTPGAERRKWFKHYLFNLLTFLCPFRNSLFKVHGDSDAQNNSSVSLSKLNFTTCNLDFSKMSNHRGLEILAQIYSGMKKVGHCPESCNGAQSRMTFSEECCWGPDTLSTVLPEICLLESRLPWQIVHGQHFILLELIQPC